MTPPPAVSVAALMQPEVEVPDSVVNRDLLVPLGRPSLRYWALLGAAVLAVVYGLAVWGYQIYVGMGVAGYAHPIFWGVYIVTFVFWVGIAHAGTLISAILYLFRSKWRNAINRSAEAMTVFAVATAGLFPLIHLGRVYKAYWLLPYPNERGLWPNFKSPLLWDVFAISTYATTSIVFFYVGLIPDIAIARDRAKGWRKLLYTALALGWHGTARQWKAHNRTVLHLSGLATPLVLSVHSVVSWDFAMSIVPGWHATIFAPYFVAGAIFSGMALVATVVIPIRRIYGLESYITDYHLDNMAKFILLTSTIVGYAYATEYFVAWYSGVEPEQTAFYLRAFGPYWVSTWIMISCNAIIPQLFWFKKLRTNVLALFVIAFLVNIGMWFERYVIIVGSLSTEYNTSIWTTYTPTWVELSILTWSFAWFSMFFLIFLKLFPVVAIAEMKEIAIHEKEHKRGPGDVWNHAHTYGEIH